MTFDRAEAARLARVSRLAYERDAEALAAGLLEAGYTVYRRFDHPPTGTQAIVVWNDREAVFAGRGTERNFADILTDLKFRREAVAEVAGVGIHRGFLAAWRGISVAVLATLQDCSNQGKRIVFAGHSLGGALAVLAAVAFARGGIAKYPRAVTFGCPRVGDAAFAAWAAHLFEHVRVVKGCDAVPLLPFLLLGFRHGVRSIYVDTRGRIHEGTHVMAEAAHRLAAWITLDFTRTGRFTFQPARHFTDHRLAGYAAALDRAVLEACPTT